MPYIQLQFRRDTSHNWACTNPVLASGEMGIEIDTHMFKIGDGCSPWVNLPYGGIQGPRGPQGPSGGSSGSGVTGPQGSTGPIGVPGQGVPVGGTSGQILAKIDSSNYNTRWVNPGTVSATSNYYIELTYPTTNGLFDRGTLPTVATSNLPPSYTVSLVSGSLRITNSQVTNVNSWQLLLGPIFVQYASGSIDMATWIGNQTWEYWSPSAGIFVNTAGVINVSDSSFGNMAGSGAFAGSGDGSPRVLLRIVVSPFFLN